MVRHFSLWRNIPQWAVWLFHASSTTSAPACSGSCSTRPGTSGRAAAVFYAGSAGRARRAAAPALHLHHELGHCFNLLHSWQKSLATPPVPTGRPRSSWMNYPWRFPGGAGAFWSGFPFKFDTRS